MRCEQALDSCKISKILASAKILKQILLLLAMCIQESCKILIGNGLNEIGERYNFFE